ncbi:hypothetical protein PXO_05670 [Xanthomonas oryzae pv. oryzae PXO99A]|uniref:Uncharacterized protein n=1 Tax=Xanthomonas oryzae pv. oryzae (strain PXO99A) TaxID=360094 RepID=A0A0K0GMS2_XANOP|nr:hypothetical protein PXO_05670 [Xanthomonas oryzae pv. oryzae PXO99A]
MPADASFLSHSNQHAAACLKEAAAMQPPVAPNAPGRTLPTIISTRSSVRARALRSAR